MKRAFIELGGQKFNLEITETIFEKTKGLMDRDYLHDNAGMLFVFNFEWIYPFTMKNMKFPLDIIWIDRHEKIVYIAEYVKPCRAMICPAINPWKRAKYVLEVNAGTVKKLGLKIEDKITLPQV